MHAGTLVAWGSKVRDEVEPVPHARRSSRGGAAFLPVRVIDGGQAALREGACELEIVLLNGRRVRVSGDFQADAVARLLEVAEGGARC